MFVETGEGRERVDQMGWDIEMRPGCGQSRSGRWSNWSESDAGKARRGLGSRGSLSQEAV